MRRECLLLLVLLILVECHVSVTYATGLGEVDETVTVSMVFDGDTFNATSGETIRLADIDAPEYREAGYEDARLALSSLVGDKTVYLDIDDVYRTDTYGRLVCVVYVDYNLTHLKNVNKALLAMGVVTVWDHVNEFNPYTWTLYGERSVIPEYSGRLIILAVASVTIIASALARHGQSDQHQLQSPEHVLQEDSPVGAIIELARSTRLLGQTQFLRDYRHRGRPSKTYLCARCEPLWTRTGP